jgi:hypothetical protein
MIKKVPLAPDNGVSHRLFAGIFGDELELGAKPPGHRWDPSPAANSRCDRDTVSRNHKPVWDLFVII